jgi:hypothetical protein
MSGFNYSKWDNIDDGSDSGDETPKGNQKSKAAPKLTHLGVPLGADGHPAPVKRNAGSGSARAGPKKTEPNSSGPAPTKKKAGGARAGSGPRKKEPDLTRIARRLNTIDTPGGVEDTPVHECAPMKTCPYCKARLFESELNVKNGNKDRWGICCCHGDIKFPPRNPAPLAMKVLLGGQLSEADRKTPEGQKIVDARVEEWVLSGKRPTAEDLRSPEAKEVYDRFLARHPDQREDSRGAAEADQREDSRGAAELGGQQEQCRSCGGFLEAFKKTAQGPLPDDDISAGDYASADDEASAWLRDSGDEQEDEKPRTVEPTTHDLLPGEQDP